MTQLSQIFETLIQLGQNLLSLAVELLQFAMTWSLVIAWLAWWLLGVNWQRAWPALRRGGWAPVVLLMLVAALVWSRIEPAECTCLGFLTLGNFWWQLGGVGLLVAVALFCGWLQGILNWTPEEMNLNPPAHADHGHGHATHGHGH